MKYSILSFLSWFHPFVFQLRQKEKWSSWVIFSELELEFTYSEKCWSWGIFIRAAEELWFIAEEEELVLLSVEVMKFSVVVDDWLKFVEVIVGELMELIII